MKTEIYERLEDLHVTARITFGNTEDNKLYYDEDFTKQVTLEDGKNWFLKGSLVVFVDVEDEGQTLARPLGVVVTNSGAVVSMGGDESYALLVEETTAQEEETEEPADPETPGDTTQQPTE